MRDIRPSRQHAHVGSGLDILPSDVCPIVEELSEVSGADHNNNTTKLD